MFIFSAQHVRAAKFVGIHQGPISRGSNMASWDFELQLGSKTKKLSTTQTKKYNDMWYSLESIHDHVCILGQSDIETSANEIIFQYQLKLADFIFEADRFDLIVLIVQLVVVIVCVLIAYYDINRKLDELYTIAESILHDMEKLVKKELVVKWGETDMFLCIFGTAMSCIAARNNRLNKKTLNNDDGDEKNDDDKDDEDDAEEEEDEEAVEEDEEAAEEDEDAVEEKKENVKRQREENVKRQREEDVKRQREEDVKRQREEDVKRQREEDVKRQREEDVKRQKEEDVKRQKEEDVKRQREEEEARPKREEEERNKGEEMQKKREDEERNKNDLTLNTLKRRTPTQSEKIALLSNIQKQMSHLMSPNKINTTDIEFVDKDDNTTDPIDMTSGIIPKSAIIQNSASQPPNKQLGGSNTDINLTPPQIIEVLNGAVTHLTFISDIINPMHTLEEVSLYVSKMIKGALILYKTTATAHDFGGVLNVNERTLADYLVNLSMRLPEISLDATNNELYSHWYYVNNVVSSITPKQVFLIWAIAQDVNQLRISELLSKKNGIYTFVRTRFDESIAVTSQVSSGDGTRTLDWHFDPTFKQLSVDRLGNYIFADVTSDENCIKPVGGPKCQREQYVFGPFTRVLDQNLHSDKQTNQQFKTNSEVAKCKDLHKLTAALDDGKTIVIMGYGLSGAGKTSLLIYTKQDDKHTPPQYLEENGVIYHLLNNKFANTNPVGVTMNVVECAMGDLECKEIMAKKKYETTPKGLHELAVDLKDANDRRRTEATANNDQSSRGHVIATIKLPVGTIVLADFAGYETKFNCDDKDVLAMFDPKVYLEKMRTTSKYRDNFWHETLPTKDDFAINAILRSETAEEQLVTFSDKCASWSKVFYGMDASAELVVAATAASHNAPTKNIKYYNDVPIQWYRDCLLAYAAFVRKSDTVNEFTLMKTVSTVDSSIDSSHAYYRNHKTEHDADAALMLLCKEAAVRTYLSARIRCATDKPVEVGKNYLVLLPNDDNTQKSETLLWYYNTVLKLPGEFTATFRIIVDGDHMCVVTKAGKFALCHLKNNADITQDGKIIRFAANTPGGVRTPFVASKKKSEDGKAMWYDSNVAIMQLSKLLYDAIIDAIPSNPTIPPDGEKNVYPVERSDANNIIGVLLKYVHSETLYKWTVPDIHKIFQLRQAYNEHGKFNVTDFCAALIAVIGKDTTFTKTQTLLLRTTVNDSLRRFKTDQLAYIKSECEARNDEGVYIRQSLGELRAFMNAALEFKGIHPPLHPACFNTYTSVVARDEPSPVLPAFFDKMDPKRVVFCIFGVVDLTGKANPRPQYISTYECERALKRATSVEELTIASDALKTTLDKIKQTTPTFANFIASSKDGQSILDRLSADLTAAPDKLRTARKNINAMLEILAGYNANTQIGVLQFMDRMSKAGLTTHICKVQKMPFDESSQLIGSTNSPSPPPTQPAAQLKPAAQPTQFSRPTTKNGRRA
jgi:hypothetical protein